MSFPIFLTTLSNMLTPCTTTHLSAMQTCGSLPGMYCIHWFFFPLHSSLPVFTFVCAGGALLNRLVVCRGVTSQRRCLVGAAYRQAVSPVSPTFTRGPSCCCCCCRCTLGLRPHTYPPTHLLARFDLDSFSQYHMQYNYMFATTHCLCVNTNAHRM